jgi:hypothetical protein
VWQWFDRNKKAASIKRQLSSRVYNTIYLLPNFTIKFLYPKSSKYFFRRLAKYLGRDKMLVA